jgi:hypothetical protein
MERLFHNTVSALCYDLARGHNRRCLPANREADFAWMAAANREADFAWMAAANREADFAWMAAANREADFAWMAAANDAVRFVLRQHARMPRHLGWGIRAATLLLAASGLLFSGALYHRLTPAQRGRIVLKWKQASLQPFRDLIRFYESLVVMAIYSRPASLSPAGETA